MGVSQNRRTFLITVGTALGAVPLAGSPDTMMRQNRPRLKITDVRIVNLRMIKEVGSLEPGWLLGSRFEFRVGGGSIVEIHTDQGLVGIGHGIPHNALSAVRAYLIGKDPFDTEVHFPALNRANPPIRGVAGIDIALWDLVGKACGQPLYKLWGGEKDRVVPYAAMVQVSTPEERAALAVRLSSEGWKAMKLRLHAPTMQEDLRIFETVKKAVGDKMAVGVDANQDDAVRFNIKWDFKRALETGRALQEMGCSWLEEPLKRDDLEGNAELARRLDMPIAGGENERDLAKFARMIRLDSFDILNPESLIVGIYGMRKIAAAAELFGKRIVPHTGLFRLGTIAQLHLLAAWSHGPYIEILHDPPIGSYLVNFKIFKNPPLLDKDGYLPLPQGPGLGVEIDPDLILKS
jgi:D-galactarolactone cycloisomerase